MTHLTAISRKRPSAPMRELFALGCLTGRRLDYGCGRGFDAKHYGMDSYDPHYQPIVPMGLFDTITCNFVLNVIESHEERLQVIRDILNLLDDDGSAYITVRTDKKALKGTTRRGTWQGFILMNLPVVATGSGFKVYLLQHENAGQLTMCTHTF